MKLTPLRILAIGWAVILVYSYPGFIDTAAADMLLDARAEQFGDWYSPIMARVTWLVTIVIGGPPGLLVLQSLLFLGGTYALLRRRCTDRTAAFVACGCLLFPPVLGIQAVICQASLFAGLALAGTALLTSVHARRKIGGLAVLLVACGIHPAAPFAVFPLVVLGLEWRAGMPRVRRYAIAVVAFAAILGGAIVLEDAIVEERSFRQEIALERYDIKGVAQQLHVEPSALVEDRATVIAEHPGAYAKHRLRHLKRLLLANTKLQTSFTEHPTHAATISHRGRHSLVQRALIAPVKLVTKGIGRPYIYLVIGLGVLAFACARKQRGIVMLIASGIMWELAAAVYTTTIYTKQSHWLVVTAVVGAALAWATRRPGPK